MIQQRRSSCRRCRLQSPRTSLSATAPDGDSNDDSGDLLPSLHAQACSVQPQQLHCDQRHEQGGQCGAPLTARGRAGMVDGAQGEPGGAGGNDIDDEEPRLQPAPDLADRSGWPATS